MRVEVCRLENGLGLDLPSYGSVGSSGMDLRAAIVGSLVLGSGCRCLVPCGISLSLPVGFEGQVRSRSGLALDRGVVCLNSPGTIDSDYRGEVGVILMNHGCGDFVIERGMRVAQLVICGYVCVEWAEVAELDVSDRGGGGFGSTGL